MKIPNKMEDIALYKNHLKVKVLPAWLMVSHHSLLYLSDQDQHLRNLSNLWQSATHPNIVML